MSSTYTSVTVIPGPAEISTRVQPDIVSIDLGDFVTLVFSAAHERNGLAALDRLEQAVHEARAALVAVTSEPVPA